MQYRLVDNFGREINRLRIKITHKCNYMCFFCHNEGFQESNDLLTVDDIDFIVSTCMDAGIDRFKITGGEPLLRSDIIDIVKTISKYDPRDLSLSTNGYYLDRYVYELKKAGLKRINISVHSLNRKVYKYITGIDALNKVLSNVEETSRVGFSQVKLDVLVLTINVHEIFNFVNLAEKLGIDLQFIELMPIGKAKYIFNKYHVDIYQVLEKLKRRYNVKNVKFRRDLHYRPLIKINNITIEFVKGYCNPKFCMNCRQVRLTSNGVLYACIYDATPINVIDTIKSRRRDEFVRKLKLLCLLRRPRF